MSAIWGIISSQKKENFPQIASAMKERMSSFKIDRIEEVQQDQVFFACGHQYLTQEARWEILPFYDKEHDTFFTADCIIDNRQELIEQLSVVVKSDECISDGRLAWLAWLKWGEKFVLHLRGIFSIAIYDRKKDLFLLYTDHMGGRCINYSITDEGICFSTTYDLFRCGYLKEELSVSEKWITGGEALTSACMIMFPGLTPYENVYQVLAGHYLRVERGQVSVLSYWDPRKTPELHLPDREAYGELFRSTFTQCVKDLLRPGVKIAAQLSSGLDSTAVVSLAAPILEERGQILNTYTSVPDPSFPLKKDRYHVADESDRVRKTAEYFPNIVCHFVSAEGSSALTNLNEIVQSYGFPVKSVMNLPWIERINQEAYDAGCRYILAGQHGNLTISFGDILSLTYQQLQQFHPIRAYRTARAFTNRNKIYFRSFIKRFICEWGNNHIYPGNLFVSSLFRNTYVRKSLLRRYHVIGVTIEQNKRVGYGSECSRKQKRQLPYQLDEQQQLGMYTTLQSLRSGIVQRDPTQDPRIVELCISFPMEQFVAEGTERYLVRGQMAGIVPDHIRRDIWHRGQQGADFVYRINRNWKSEREVVLRYLQVPSLTQYLEPKKLDEMIRCCQKADSFSDQDQRFLLDTVFFTTLGCFLSQT